jgi:hypothetical protein
MPWLEAFLPDDKVKDTSKVLIRTVINLSRVIRGQTLLAIEEAVKLQTQGGTAGISRPS